MTTAHEQYYTQPDAGPVHITYEDIYRLGWELSDHDTVLSSSDDFINEVGNAIDTHTCRCGENVGYHMTHGGPWSDDTLSWYGDFYVIDEDGSTVLCETCFDRVTAEPDYDEPEHDEVPLPEYTPQERAVMAFFDSLFQAFEPKYPKKN